jgi:hypothetical protein
MIITEFLEGQGLGNQLWVHAAGCSIAEQLGVPYLAVGLERFKGADFLTISNLPGARHESPDLGGAREFHELVFYDPEMKAVMYDFDERVCTLSGPTILRGCFQSEKYFFGDLLRARRYIALNSKWGTPAVDERTCILNVRGGEYKRHRNLILPQGYWLGGIDIMRRQHGIDRFVVVTDDPSYAKAVLPGIPVLEGGIAACYAALYHARYAVLSNSSFSYFPVKGGAAKTCVIAPVHWARFANPWGRWASPANIYADWQWLDASGRLLAYSECLQIAEATAAYYRKNFHVLSTMGAVAPPGWRNHVPATFRRTTKRALSYIFPQRFG